MPPKYDPFASNLKELIQYQSDLPDDDGMNTRQRLRAKRREEGKEAYLKELPYLEKKAAENPITHDKRHQQIDHYNNKPSVTNLVSGKYYEPKKLVKEPLSHPYLDCQQTSCPTCGHDTVEDDGDAAECCGNAISQPDGGNTKPSQAPEEISTQTRARNAVHSTLPYATDPRVGNDFKLGGKQTSVQTSATGHTVRNVGVEVTPDELYEPKPPAPWDKVPEETKKGRVPVTKNLEFVAERTIQTETDLKGHFWDREMKEKNGAAGSSSEVVLNQEPSSLPGKDLHLRMKEIPDQQRPQSSKQRFQSNPRNTIDRLF